MVGMSNQCFKTCLFVINIKLLCFIRKHVLNYCLYIFTELEVIIVDFIDIKLLCFIRKHFHNYCLYIFTELEVIIVVTGGK